MNKLGKVCPTFAAILRGFVFDRARIQMRQRKLKTKDWWGGCKRVHSRDYFVKHLFCPSTIRSVWDTWDAVLDRSHSSTCARYALIQFKVVHCIHMSGSELARRYPITDPNCKTCLTHTTQRTVKFIFYSHYYRCIVCKYEIIVCLPRLFVGWFVSWAQLWIFSLVGCGLSGCLLFVQAAGCLVQIQNSNKKNTEITVMLLPYLRIPSLPWPDTSSPARCSWKARKHPATGRPRTPGRRSLRCRRHTDRPSCSGWRCTWPLRCLDCWHIPLLWCSQTPPRQITTEKKRILKNMRSPLLAHETRKRFQQRCKTCSNNPQHHDVWPLS